MLDRNGTLLAIILVILLMGTTAGTFLLFQAMSDRNPDPYDHSADYVFDGTVDGIQCTGKGHSYFVNESQTDHLYRVDYTIGSVTSRFDLIFNSDERMEPSSVYRDMGEGTFDGKSVHIWTATVKGIDYTFYVGGHCLLEGVHIVSDTMDVVGRIA